MQIFPWHWRNIAKVGQFTPTCPILVQCWRNIGTILHSNIGPLYCDQYWQNIGHHGQHCKHFPNIGAISSKLANLRQHAQYWFSMLTEYWCNIAFQYWCNILQPTLANIGCNILHQCWQNMGHHGQHCKHCPILAQYRQTWPIYASMPNCWSNIDRILAQYCISILMQYIATNIDTSISCRESDRESSQRAASCATCCTQSAVG